MKTLDKRRTAKLARIERDKQTRKTYKEYTETWRGWKESYQDLDEPLRRGFKRNLVLKPSCYRRADIQVLENLLPLVDVQLVSNNRVFKSWDSKLGRYTKELVHNPGSLNQKAYDKLTRKEKDYFHPVWHHNRWGDGGHWSYSFANKQLLISHMSKWFVTRVPILDPDNQSCRDQLNDKMYGTRYMMRDIDRMFCNSWNNRDDWDQIKNNVLHKQALKEAHEEIQSQGLDMEDDPRYEDYMNNIYGMDCYDVLDEEEWYEIGFFRHYCYPGGE